MPHPLLPGLILALALAAGGTYLLGPRGGKPAPTPAPAAAVAARESATVVAPEPAAVGAPESATAAAPSADPEELAARARALLGTDRPWSAARAMRRYMESVPDPSLEHRLLAARAEAGWGDWTRVLSLLDGVSGLEAEDGIGLYLLARARDEAGDARGAAASYERFLALSSPAAALDAERDAARLRLGLALVRAGDAEAGRRELRRAAEAAGGAAVWIELLEAAALAATGDTAAVRRAIAGHDAGLAGLYARRARVEAALQAGDLAAARALANQARAWARTSATQAEFLVVAGRIAIEMGDVAPGRAALRAAIDRVPGSAYAREAAALLRQGPMSAADHLAVARVYAAQGLHQQSLDGFRRWLDAGAGTPAERTDVRIEYAEALFRAGRTDEVEPALRPVAGERAARLLLARSKAQSGDADAAVRLYLSVADEFDGSHEGASALFLAANVRHDTGDDAAARELYRRVVSRYPGHDRMGLAMMRLAGMAFLEGDHAGAARIWDDYRARYPNGTRALQATYWAGRARTELGDADGATRLFRWIRQREPDSYYAVLASRWLGQPFWPVPMGPSPSSGAAAARQVAEWMRGIDLLRAAGFADEASAEADRVVAAAGGDEGTLYALAETLAERGYSRRAIQLGLRLQRGGPPNPRLLRILHPFPYRTLITEEARDEGVDPFLAAALIRQESLFEERVTSPAGARGLMQIMPATGRALADSLGLGNWSAEVLYHPEINVHLGVGYMARHIENYAGSLPSVFSAYNAGWHRVAAWSAYPEYGDDELFTERIPFRETRDYVRILTRNLAVYQGLYGGD